MNIDALFEDLEAEVYFHASAKPTPPTKHCKLAVVAKGQAGTSRVVLSSPLLGEDFIAGFTNPQQPSWVVIPSGHMVSVESLDENKVFSKANFNLSALLENKLSGILLQIETNIGSTRHAQISSMHGRFIEILAAGKLIQLATASIISITVENLSALEQRSAT